MLLAILFELSRLKTVDMLTDKHYKEEALITGDITEHDTVLLIMITHEGVFDSFSHGKSG